eukprot:2946030-Rhodomonas_salina.2
MSVPGISLWQYRTSHSRCVEGGLDLSYGSLCGRYLVGTYAITGQRGGRQAVQNVSKAPSSASRRWSWLFGAFAGTIRYVSTGQHKAGGQYHALRQYRTSRSSPIAPYAESVPDSA